jgi:hypothetical protein
LRIVDGDRASSTAVKERSTEDDLYGKGDVRSPLSAVVSVLYA